MRFFNNRHIVAALIVTPVLAIASYYLVDLVLKEKPHKAVAGQAYKLVAQANCRFSSGVCGLKNGNFEITITVSQSDDQTALMLSSNKVLQLAHIGFVTPDGLEQRPFQLTAKDKAGKNWQTQINPAINYSDAIMRVALNAGNARYYSETTMEFATYETSYKQDFRQQN